MNSVLPGVELTRVTRRELGLICRYSLVQAGLDLGHVAFGARLIAAAEIQLGCGLSWLARYVRERPPAHDLQVVEGTDKTLIHASGSDFLVAAPAAVDVLTLGVRRGRSATVLVENVADVALASLLTESAARRGIAALVRAVPVADIAGEAPIITPAAGWPGQPWAGLDREAMRAPYGTPGDIYLLGLDSPAAGARSDWKAPAGEGITSLSTWAPETVDVSFALWVELLDLVGGTLPPDGRGRLTSPTEAAPDDAGPGAGKRDDDD